MPSPSPTNAVALEGSLGAATQSCTGDAPDAGLVGRALNGDAGAMAVLLERHRPALVAVCRRFAGDPSLAEDCVQDAALLALLRLSELKAPEQFGAWLRGIGIRVCRRALHARSVEQRRRTSGRETESALESLPAGDPWPEEPLALGEVGRSLRAAIADLPSGQREAIRQFYLRGQGYEAAAACLGIPVSALKMRLHKARLALRQRLDLRIGIADSSAAARWPSPRVIATHEAGHAVLGFLDGMTISRISIDRADAQRGVSRSEPIAPPGAASPTYRLLTATMAGEAAELYIHPTRRHRPNSGDRPTAAALAHVLTGGDPVESALVVDQARRAALEQLANPRIWCVVEHVAQALIARTVLDGDAFREVVTRAYRRPS